MENKATKAILEDLSDCGVCQTGKRYLQGTQKDLATLVKVWKGWPEYFYEHSAYALQVMRKHMDEKLRHQLAGELLFVDFKGEAIIGNGDEQVYFIGDSHVDVRVDDFTVGTIYLFNEANVTLRAGINVFLTVEAFDDSCLNIAGGEKGRIMVYKYDRSKITGTARIKPKEYIRGKVFNGKEINR